MRIGELAKRTGASVRSLRYYEQQGLLWSHRSNSGQRHYSEDQVARVEFLKRLYAAGLSSRTIVELLPCTESPSIDNAEAAFARMLHERDRISDHIENLMRTRDALDTLIEANQAHRATLAQSARSTAS
ncbi:MerR family transcriptional regulator [Saccharomonospora halophila]|uniref:MerR family transcriptional regulator n=1 Tax=Saccharomonospora halophila TaxID=129922 RepID=UPI0003727173|nr:MerR family transcriptional regulator [Saccharomonospora halophila]